MATKQDEEQQQHIVMIPFMAQGHLIPFLALATHIIRRRPTFSVTVATTPLNVLRLRSSVSDHSQIHLAELHFCSSDHGLPPNVESTESLPLDLIGQLFHSSVSLEPHFRRLVSDIIRKDGRPPLCIVSDVFMGWAAGVAKSFGTRNITFSTCGAYGSAAYMSIWLNLPHRSADAGGEFTTPGFPESCHFHVTQLHRFIRKADGSDWWSKFFQPQIALSLSSDGWLCNTAEEIEPFGLKILRNYTKLPVWAIGPLLPSNPGEASSSSKRTGRVPGVSLEKCVEWLEGHPERSVLYISFGSQNTIGRSQMMELAMGLEESLRPFIWVIRPPIGSDPSGEFRQEWLPEGFERRIGESGKGLLVHGWAPQLEILAHRSTGAFLSHCGWNSVLESLSHGVPMIGWPLAGEQAYNAKMLVEEMGVGVELTRGTEGRVAKEEVKRAVEIVMGSGGELRRRATEIMRLIGEAAVDDAVGGVKGSSVRAMDDFLESMLSSKA